MVYSRRCLLNRKEKGYLLEQLKNFQGNPNPNTGFNENFNFSIGRIKSIILHNNNFGNLEGIVEELKIINDEKLVD